MSVKGIDRNSIQRTAKPLFTGSNPVVASIFLNGVGSGKCYQG